MMFTNVSDNERTDKVLGEDRRPFNCDRLTARLEVTVKRLTEMSVNRLPLALTASAHRTLRSVATRHGLDPFLS